RSEGAEIDFPVTGSQVGMSAGSGAARPPSDANLQPATVITVFTTRPDTIFGATFVALAPEHPLVREIVAAGGPHAAEVRAYAEAAARRLELERQQGVPNGVFAGLYATNPANGERIPVWVADYVLAGYGTGAIMGVPAHDERDRRFAEAYDLPIGDDRQPMTDDGRVRFDDSGVQVEAGRRSSVVG
ncbi:hypothetical protein SE17_43240, partial [Kouleothrix aurantiaca]